MPGPGAGSGDPRSCRRLAEDLDALGARRPGPRIVIDGDFTSRNVLAGGIPAAPTGVIGFQRAHLEMPVADIGYGLWRSGRPHQEAARLDLAKLRQFVRGYACAMPLPADAAHALPVFLHGRGPRMLARRVLAGKPASGLVPQVRWAAASAATIAGAAGAAAS